MVWKIVKVFDSVLDWDLAIGIWDWKDRTKCEFKVMHSVFTGGGFLWFLGFWFLGNQITW